ncbi:ferric reductase NAD binding domain-containing protein [Immersiella caudata]|uniref:Ferric reductase NAD binding domain-containing protein n=1 Tax=Immersiella caudata TaxID=314043 RepID=A0AA39WIZ7_9PEZI|nr:ferric reductase NAD binding domain-containing protein [Immersiella caudata]
MAGPTPAANSTGQGASRGGTGPSFTARKLANEEQIRIYAASLCGLIAVFVLFHWTRWLCARVERSMKSNGKSALGLPFVRASRLVRNILVRKVPGFNSAGHALLVSTYVAINLAITFTNLDKSSITNYASRFAVMGLGNLAFVVFLALKNTPLAILTAYSYERLNCLHRIAGYTVFLYIILHAALYTAYFNSTGRMVTMYAERKMIAAIVAGFALLTGVFASTVLRRIWYEAFYVVHICSFITLIVGIGFHQPDFGKGLIVTLFIASMWFSDRLLRAARLVIHSANNEATLHPLPNGGTKVVIKKMPLRAQAGKHCFVWIPAIRKFETHPFTIHRTNPVEFTVKAHNGFTRDLHKYASENPGVKVKASLDGPYGTFPDPMEFDKIVLIAGGGGATFTFGMAVNVLERMKDEAHKNITFIWAVKKHENLSWFKEQLELLKTHAHSPKVDIDLYVTQSPAALSQTTAHHGDVSGSGSSQSSLGGPSPPLSPTADDIEKGATLQFPAPTKHSVLSEKELERGIETRVEHHLASESDKEGGAVSTTTSHSEHPVKAGRPDLTAMIRNAVTTTPSNQRVLIAACGPDGLMHFVRDTTAKLILGDGPAVELHCEQFGW